jgi:hypothetical protein
MNNLAHGQGTTGFTFPLTTLPDTWSLIDLYGCTSVIVLSRKRMFMTHIWEAPQMTTPQRLTGILDGLRNGDIGVPQGLAAFTGPGGDFEDTQENKVRAFIITPYRRSGPISPAVDDLEFPYEIGKIKDLLKTVLGRDDTITVPYIALGPDPRFQFPFGKVLIQYDPVAAWLGRADGGCSSQVAGIELWFESDPRHRYRDRWAALPSQQLPANPLRVRSSPASTKDIRLLKGRELSDTDEEEWKEYGVIFKREESEAGACPLHSKSIPSSSNSPSSTPRSSSTILLPFTSPSPSQPQDPTTLQTSFVSSSGSEITSGASAITLSSSLVSTEYSSSALSTPEPYLSSPLPSLSPTFPPPPLQSSLSPSPGPASPTRAISIIMRYLKSKTDEYNSWTIFETTIGAQADGCGVPALNDLPTRWVDPKALKNPPWPHGTFTLPLFGEENCQFFADGTNPGILHCPSMGAGNNVGCEEDMEKKRVSAVTPCHNDRAVARSYHRAVYCVF